MIRICIATALLTTSCASAPPTPQTPNTELAARLAHAGTSQVCPVVWGGHGMRITSDCLDDDGLVWSACAWNACGIDPSCRTREQEAAVLASCGGPEWPACKP
jgi:hypothetical protein